MNLATMLCIASLVNTAKYNHVFRRAVIFPNLTAVFTLILLQRHLTPPQLAPLSYGKDEKDGGEGESAFTTEFVQQR